MDRDIRIALLGDHEAAKRLTERYELLPCPCCGGQARCFGGTSIAYVHCKVCGLEICRMDALRAVEKGKDEVC